MISIIFDRRGRAGSLGPEQPGGVRRPTYGIVIKDQIRQLAKAADIRVVCLKSQDFYNVLWAKRGIFGVEPDEFWRIGSWLGCACLEDSAVFLNATALRESLQPVVDFVCFHEMAHVLLQTTDEKETDAGAIELAKQLQVKIPTEVDGKSGLISLGAKRANRTTHPIDPAGKKKK